MAFRVAVQGLGQRRLRETFAKLLRWLSKCRAADAKKLRLLSRMSFLIESFHDRLSKKKLRKWYRWMRKMIWIENRQRWGSTKLQKILSKAHRRNQRRRLYNAYMALYNLNAKYKADQLRKRMAANKVRKMLWRRMMNGCRRVFFNLRRMGLEPYIVKLQWAWRSRMFQRNKGARSIQCAWRRHVAKARSTLRRTNIRINAHWFIVRLIHCWCAVWCTVWCTVGCTMDVLLGVLWCTVGCTMDVLLGVLWIYYGCTMGVLRVYYGCTMDVLLGVLWMFYGCTLVLNNPSFSSFH